MIDKNPYPFQFFGVETPLDAVLFNVASAHRVKQIHSAKAIEVNGPQSEWVDADAIVTRQPNLPIGVITADCVPVLFEGEGVVGAAHAGWQGALYGVLENTIKIMNIDPMTITAHIGPSIQQQSYEVSVGFEKPFIGRNTDAEQFFTPGREGKLHFDLPAYCMWRLNQCGIKHIICDGRDTLTNPDFYSHRGGAKSTERNLSAIMIRK